MTTAKTTPRIPAAINAQTDLVTLLGHLVRFPTISTDQATNQAALDWVKHQLRHLPLQVHDFIYNGFPALIMTTRPTKRPKVILMAHMDVLPGPADLFELRQENGRLYGRGVFDMKLAIAVYMKLLLELGERLSEYDLGLMITTDEELGGEQGIARLVQAGWRADVIINPDAGDSWAIERAAKGKAYFKVESHGENGHGSRPWAYRSAIVQLMAFLQELRGHFQSEPCGNASHAHNTIMIGTMSGGVAHNQVPHFAEAEIDIRFMPGQEAESMSELVRSVAAHYDHIRIVEETLGRAFEVDPDNTYTRLMEQLLTDVLGHAPRFLLSHGATDSRYFAGTGVPIILTRPEGGEQHANGEWLDAKGLEQMLVVTRAFVERVGRG